MLRNIIVNKLLTENDMCILNSSEKHFFPKYLLIRAILPNCELYLSDSRRECALHKCHNFPQNIPLGTFWQNYDIILWDDGSINWLCTDFPPVRCFYGYIASPIRLYGPTVPPNMYLRQEHATVVLSPCHYRVACRQPLTPSFQLPPQPYTK